MHNPHWGAGPAFANDLPSAPRSLAAGARAALAVAATNHWLHLSGSLCEARDVVKQSLVKSQLDRTWA